MSTPERETMLTEGKFILRPITLRAANEFVAAHHRHNKPVRGCKFCVAAIWNGLLVGVAIVGRPVARNLDNGLTAEVLRLCVMDGAPRNACSFLYNKARRIWSTMGGERIVTYTLEVESGASLRGAGWSPAATVKGKEWSNARRPRQSQAVYALDKIRWEG